MLILLLYLASEQFNWIYAMFTLQRIYFVSHYVAGGVKLFSITARAGRFKQDHEVGTHLSIKATTGCLPAPNLLNIAKT